MALLAFGSKTNSLIVKGILILGKNVNVRNSLSETFGPGTICKIICNRLVCAMRKADMSVS